MVGRGVGNERESARETSRHGLKSDRVVGSDFHVATGYRPRFAALRRVH